MRLVRNDHLVKHRVSRALREMTPELKERCEDVRQLLGVARRAGCEARHRIGAIVVRIMDEPAKYGTAGVALLAAAVGRNEDTLYGYASVARRWSAESFASLCRRVGTLGVPLTFAHFIVVAQVEPSDQRAALVERCLREGLSVRQLRRIVDAGDEDALPTKRRPTLRRALATSRATLGIVRALDQVLEDVRSKPVTPKLAAQLDRLIASYRELHDGCASGADAFADELRRIREAAIRRDAFSRRAG